MTSAATDAIPRGEASWDALVDSLEAGMLPGRVHHSRSAAARTTT